MDQKQAKKLLLEARNAIKNKDFKSAVQNCETILDKDPRDYNALVFLGAALQELQVLDRALNSFKTAVQIAPNQLLAWQGLQKYYEKDASPECRKHLREVYLKLLELITDKEKCGELWLKLGSSYLDENNFKEAEECFTKALDLLDLNSSLGSQSWISMVTCLVSQTNLSQMQLVTLQKGVDKILEGKLNKMQEYEKWNFDYSEKYFNFLNQELQPTQLLQAVKRFESIFIQNIVGLSKWKLRAFISGFLLGDSLLESDEIEAISSLLAESDNDASALVLFAKGIFLYKEKNWISSKDFVKKGLAQSPVCCWEGWLLMCWIFERICDWSSIEHFAKEGLKLLSTRVAENRQSAIKQLFYMSLGKGYFYQKTVLSFQASFNEFLKISDVNLKAEALYFQGLSCLYLKRLEDLSNIMDDLKQLNSALYSGLNGLYQSKLELLEEAKRFLNVALDSSYKHLHDDWLLELGELCLRENNNDLACEHFKKAAESNIYNARPHQMLGNYYRSLNNLKQAEICYKHAYTLKKYDEEIGVCLSDIYHVTKNEDENYTLLKEVTTHNAVGRCKWAWLRLGLLHLRLGTYLNAVKSLQSALTADPHDKECWECLAEAYLKHGSYTSAVKAFNRVLELDPDMLYSAYQKANIQLTLGLYKEAAELFEALLTRVPNYLPALKGLGEAYFSLARSYLQQCEPLRALSFCQSALEPLTKALTEGPQLVCLWKILGDICTIIGPLPAAIVTLHIPTTLLKGVPKYDSVVTELNKDQILKLGARCYSLACSRSSRSSLMWHDLSINCYYQSKELPEAADKIQMLNKAITFAKRAVALDPTTDSHWNFLGVINVVPEIRNYRLAQHCFIKAATVSPKNPVVWSNLGALYLLNDNIELAHKSFSIAQSLEPSYPNAWIGQAACAEMVGHDDKMDLFRHCTTLNNHTESSIGYACWVCNTLLDATHLSTEYNYHIREMNAIPAAVDCITRFTNVVIDNPCAYNVMGLLLERQGLLRTAASSFKKAVGLTDKVHEQEIIYTNIARIQRKLYNYKQSTESALKVKEPEFYNLCGLAFTYYLQGLMEESSSTYEVAFSLTSSDEEKAHLLVALASIAYTVQGSNEAKTLLFQSCEIKPDCKQALIALSALSILDGDLNVLAAALEELTRFHQDEKAMVHLAYLRSCQAVLQGEIQVGRNLLCKAAHNWPDNFHFWKLLSKYLLQHSSANRSVRCAEAAMKLCPSPLSQVLRLLCLAYHAAGLLTDAASIAKKLIHCFPGEELNWTILKELLRS